jgi:hypothetical protein
MGIHTQHLLYLSFRDILTYKGISTIDHMITVRDMFTSSNISINNPRIISRDILTHRDM